MSLIICKYSAHQKLKTAIILLHLVLLQFFLQAQSNERADSAVLLKYQLDSTIEAAPPEEESPDDEYGEIDTTVVSKDNEENFLRKEFTGGFTDSLRLRQLPDSVVKSLQEDDAFWYANHVFKKKQQKQARGFTSHPVFQTLLWLVILVVFGIFLVQYLANSNVRIFRKSGTITDDESNAGTDDIFAINYQREIDKAIGMNDYRLAVRLMFLRVLKSLADRNIIQYKHDSTNFDYLLQLQSSGMYNEFFKITRNYEYSWYGHFDIDKEKFAAIKQEFDNFDRKIR